VATHTDITLCAVLPEKILIFYSRVQARIKARAFSFIYEGKRRSDGWTIWHISDYSPYIVKFTLQLKVRAIRYSGINSSC